MTGMDGGERSRRKGGGAASQVFGVGLLSLGVINSMLAMKAGLGHDPFNYLLLAAGAVFLTFGLWKRRR